jgi:AraC family transcriptional regulator
MSMIWQDVRWQVPLDVRPVLLATGLGVHGRVQREELFHLGSHWSLHLYSYAGEVHVNGTVLPIRPGYVGLAPPHASLLYRYGGVSQHLYAHFALEEGAGETAAVPAMQDVGADFAALTGALERAVAAFPLYPRRAEVRLWDTLWELALRQAQPTHASPTHPALKKAVGLIDLGLGNVLRISELALEVGVSQSHLNRLFQAQFGSTVVRYIRERRVQRAEQLLRYSDMPIKLVARTVGIPDLHLFNKTIRAALGDAPRRVRAEVRP